MHRRTTSLIALTVVALVVALGSLTTGPVSAAVGKTKIVKIAKKQANKVLDARAGTLAVASATTATNAQQLGGKPASAYAGVSDLVAVSGFDDACDPGSTTFTDCIPVQVTLARPSKLVINTQTPFGDDSNNGAQGTCRLLLDGGVLPNTTVRVGIDGTTAGVNSDGDNTGGGVNVVTAAVGAGAHTLLLQCNETDSDIDFNDLSMSALAIPVA
jgi:hypothetical protein